jgi:hypothetical protein
MPALTSFSTPGFINDLTGSGAAAWSDDVKTIFDGLTDGTHPQFFNPLGVTLSADAATKVVRWGAFPRKLSREVGLRRWKLAEERNRQEEYCEWAAERDRKGNITQAFFTTEVPTYYHRLANDNPDRLLEIYKSISDDVRRSDILTPGGAYKPDNPWNRLGAMHLIHPNNTLPAAVILVAEASVVRTGDQGVITNAAALIRCGINADRNRNSDPAIVADVNALARAGARITLADPLGLYIDRLQTAGWKAPGDLDPAQFWTVTRGAKGTALRGVYAVPANLGFTVSDITINGQPIVSPSQIADHLTIKISGLALNIGLRAPVTQPCSAKDSAGLESLGDQAPPSMTELLDASRQYRG